MRGKKTPELTRRAIQKAYRLGEGSYPQLATRFNVSEATVKRLCQGIAPTPTTEILSDAIAHGHPVTIGGLDLDQHVLDGIRDLTKSMATVEPKSKEGIASAALKYMQFYAELHPPTLEQLVDQLLARPDFDPERFVAILKSRYAARAN